MSETFLPLTFPFSLQSGGCFNACSYSICETRDLCPGCVVFLTILQVDRLLTLILQAKERSFSRGLVILVSKCKMGLISFQTMSCLNEVSLILVERVTRLT